MIESIIWCIVAVLELFLIGRWLILELENEVRNNNFKEVKDSANSFASELRDLFHTVNGFVNNHNSWHDRKIDFYYDKDGWHCCYCDEIPQGDVVSEQEEINEPNEHNNENNQSI